jgi:hypothetical protein
LAPEILRKDDQMGGAMGAAGHPGSRGDLDCGMPLLRLSDALPPGTILVLKLHMPIKPTMVGKTQSVQKFGIEDDHSSIGGVARDVGDTVGVSSFLWSAITSSTLAL